MKIKLITPIMIALILTSITTIAIPVKARTTWTVDDDPSADLAYALHFRRKEAQKSLHPVTLSIYIRKGCIVF